MEVGLMDFIEIKDRVEKIKKTSNFGTLFVPEKSMKNDRTQYCMQHSRDWSFIENYQEPKLFLSEFVGKLVEHKFKRYKEELFTNRIMQLQLPKIGQELIKGDMSLCQIPKSQEWMYNPLGTGDHPN